MQNGPESLLVQREISRFDPNVPLARALTPPASWYVMPEVLELERRRIFTRSWQAVGRVDQLAKAGDFFSGTLAGEPYVVLRNEAGELRAFYNVCRHHAAGIVEGTGCVRRLVCPYHGWTYGLDGGLIAGTRLDGIEDFDRASFGLRPIAVEAWGPLVFVNMRADAPSLASEIGGLRALLEERDAGATLKFRARRTYEIACNWKVYVDNYLDGGYHVPVLHRGLTSQIDMKTYRTETFGRHSIQSCAGQSAAKARIGDGAIYAWIYPNFMINRYGPVMDTNFVVPLGVDRTLTIFDFFFDESATDAFVAQSIESSERVQAEDISISESVQRGLASAGYDRGRYAPSVEKGEHHFHTLLAADLR